MCSWTVLRSQCVAEETSLKPAETGVTRNADNCHRSSADEWCSDADDWDVDVDDNNTCCISETIASNRQELISSSLCSEQTMSAATDIEHNHDASRSPLNDAIPFTSSKPSDVFGDEPSQLLQHLTINNAVEKPVSTQDMSSADVQRHTVSDVLGELSSKSVESTANVAAALESYYVYVMDESSIADHSEHVEDLLTRYSLQEGINFSAELESGRSKYVTYDIC